MPFIEIESMRDECRLWAFNAGRALGEAEEKQIESRLREFLGQWAAHGSPLDAGYQIVEDHFLLVAVDQDVSAPSGCSIDAMTRFLKELGEEMSLDFLDAPPCCYRDGDEVRCVSREEFAAMVERGSVTETTRVFDLTVPTVGAVRSEGFERKLAGSWYEKAFFGVSA